MEEFQQIIFEIKYSGSTWTDVTADVLRDPPPRGRWGIMQSGFTDHLADAGEMTFSLDNSAGNSEKTLGYYFPGAASVPFGAEVRVGFKWCNRTKYKWRGFVDVGGYVALPLVLVALGMCVAVLVMGPPINGARRWFVFGPASFQPSELAKLALCIFAATWLARRRAPRTLGELARPLGLLTLVFCGLILLEPDLGTTITLCGMMLAIFLVAGVPIRLLVVASTLAVGMGLAAIWIEPYRRARVFSFLDPWSDAQGSGFQIVQATSGIGSGGFTGSGLGEGVGKVSYLPEAHTRQSWYSSDN